MKNKSTTDFTDLEEVKKLILVNELVYRNWMNGDPLSTGVEEYKKSNPEDFKQLLHSYDKMSKALSKD